MDGIPRQEVHEALSALYDNFSLSQCSLARRFPQVAALEEMTERALRLRAVLLEGIEALRPARRAAFGSRESRACDVLTLRYVERMEIAEIIDVLAIGRRQLFRDLRQAEERLAQVLTTWASRSQEVVDRLGKTSALSSELAVLASQPADVSLRQVIEEALALVHPLCISLGVQVDIQWPRGQKDALVTGDRSILKQLAVQLLSCALQNSSREEIKLVAAPAEGSLRLTLLFWPKSEPAYERRLSELRQIAEHEGISFQVKRLGSACEVSMYFKYQQPISVMVIEDNPSAVELYRRYLSGGAWRVWHLSDPRLAYEVAKRERPDVIVLDIMMPKADGWTVLQALRHRPETENIPILLCSVIEDEGLSQVLGATEWLRKPVSQGDFLIALSRCLRAARSQPTSS